MLTNQPLRWRKIASLEQELEKVIDGDLTEGLSLTWSAAERCVILMYHIHREGQEPEVRAEFGALLDKIRKGKDPIEKLVRHELNNLPPKMKYKVMGVQSQIVAGLHLIDREIGNDTIPSDEAILLYLNSPSPEGCGGLERCRLKWLHMIADETRKARANGNVIVPANSEVKRGRGRPRLPDHVSVARSAITALRAGKIQDAIALLGKIANAG